MAKKLMLCDCAGSQTLHPDCIAEASDISCSRIHTALCTSQIELAAKEMSTGDLIIACGQEQARFMELAEELQLEMPGFVDLRDRAGWSDESRDAGPKQAALVAESLLFASESRTVDVISEGLCLILGEAEVALDAAAQLAEPLSVTVLLEQEPATLPVDRKFEIVAGVLKSAKGSLGGFSVALDALRQLDPGGRGEFSLGEPRDGAETSCDIILDLRKSAPLFPAHEKREGYLRADPGSPGSIARAVLQASQLVGTFEKPLYVRLEESLCAHSRAQKTGCTRCLDSCPTGAIAPAGDHVEIDAMVCAGCGACSAVCPSAAVISDNPPLEHLFKRITTLIEAFFAAGGSNPRLLVHTAGYGREMIALSARFGRGLPANCLPLELDSVTGFGHAELLGAIGAGFAGVDILFSPSTEREVLEREIEIAEAMGAKGRLRLVDAAEPDELSDAIYAHAFPDTLDNRVLPLGTRRNIARLSAKSLNPGSEEVLPLPNGAPYGAVIVDTGACTLCLACASLCPSGALTDNPDSPQLRFQEDACLQCGLCEKICPESAITLEPRFDLSDAVLEQKVVNEEEPYECIECGKPFGVKSTIERIAGQLAGKHSMFGSEGASRLIRMCDDCRVAAQYHSEENPFALGERPRPRTTDDYLKNRKLH
ncbi:MAG: 4Fe-4S binding protein [Albidovulum sp.]|nr:4Fe-4S binding protein [Albidovulum sp.]